jgi:cytochrome c oxidase cbb3-type subunit 3
LKKSDLDSRSVLPLEDGTVTPPRKEIPAMNNQPNEPKLLLDHDADGIKELDNNLPSWWVWLFYLCIIYAAGYMVITMF